MAAASAVPEVRRMTDPLDLNANCLSLMWSLHGTRFRGIAARSTSITDEMRGHSLPTMSDLLKDKDPKTTFSSDGLLGELKKSPG
jgi:hypothetical protein